MSAPPGPPPPPPPPPGMAGKEKQAKIEMLRQSSGQSSADWESVVKEIEQGKKLNPVQSNDRSNPMLSRLKLKK
ncbi:hypothetical protein Ocin01_09220 [Orchesella cincta]|uniref:WH2 domain-containing protein n=1 Tax=Orchesella cincta TaxID=48709 RepID=A0A1D2MWM5_ORCCI|nr:hypothetical protein Ocin01_09220 [Orchesella cincta]